MRGCLFVVVLAAIVLAAVAWFGSPVIASTVITTALQNAGFQAGSSTVTATSNPPPKLLLGRADRVEIAATDVDFRTFHAASLDLVLTNVDVIARTAGHLTGRISGAALKTLDALPTTADVDVDGPADAAAAVIVVDAATIDRVVKAAIHDRLAIAVTRTALVAPAILRITAGGATVEGRLEVDASGAIALATPFGSVPVVGLDSSLPLHLRSLSVVRGDLRIDAVLDAQALIGG